MTAFGEIGLGIYALLLIFAIVIGVLWTFLPFAVFGTKTRLDEGLALQRQILAELRALHGLLERQNGRPARAAVETDDRPRAS